MPEFSRNPADAAAEEARRQMIECIETDQSFLLEAGAGAGKTYSLIQALHYLIEKRGLDLLRRKQQVACITYTNVATDEIKSRTDGHPAILSSTIHAFCWSLIKDFQPLLRRKLPELAGWPQRLAEIDDLGSHRIEYNLGYPGAKKADKRVSLSHDDVLQLTVAMMEQPKFRHLFTTRYPVLFIDEYQDTNSVFANSICTHLLGTNEKILIGFFGDHWQKIYEDGCGKIDHPALKRINKESNFRSAPAIVNVLNRMRPDLPQQVSNREAMGSVSVYHTNEWRGSRRSGTNWGGDLWPKVASKYVDSMLEHLKTDGWSLEPKDTKYLFLTHRILAARQGYSDLLNVFQFNDAIVKKEDPHIAFLVDIVEPTATAYEERKFGEMFAAIGTAVPSISGRDAKLNWSRDLTSLLQLRKTGTVGDVMDHLRRTQRPRLPDNVEEKERELAEAGERSSNDVLRQLREVRYQQIIALTNFINDKTPFATKHGVKGAEFENVLVVFGRGWARYDFVQFLEWARNRDAIPPDQIEMFERNRNLFYVVCSRPKKRLAILFTQYVTEPAMNTLIEWFGRDAIHALDTAQTTT
ncbi:MAG TPA: UvrD-helicase domain-containing protein [Pyrinomonadaceae bacterium]|nr:UvrD-helicase domain-containing protein [Pyrinomonadaceae bacterium]